MNQITPVPAGGRIASIDVLRGFALLGILGMNIQAFAMPFCAYINPTSFGEQEGINRWVWGFGHIFFDMKFMGLFSMLFGAGVLLFADRAEARGQHPGTLQDRIEQIHSARFPVRSRDARQLQVLVRPVVEPQGRLGHGPPAMRNPYPLGLMLFWSFALTRNRQCASVQHCVNELVSVDMFPWKGKEHIAGGDFPRIVLHPVDRLAA